MTLSFFLGNNIFCVWKHFACRFSQYKRLSFSLYKSSMAAERPSHRTGGFMLCSVCVRLNERQISVGQIYRLESIMGFWGSHADKVPIATGEHTPRLSNPWHAGVYRTWGNSRYISALECNCVWLCVSIYAHSELCLWESERVKERARVCVYCLCWQNRHGYE